MPPTTTQRRNRIDRLARWTVTAGGMGIIGSILAILVFILLEVAPLASGAEVESRGGIDAATDAPAALLGDQYLTYVAGLGLDGRIRIRDVDDGGVVEEMSLLSRKGADTGGNAEGDGSASAGAGTGGGADAGAGSGPEGATEEGENGPGGDGLTAATTAPGQQVFLATTGRGEMALGRMNWRLSFDGSERVITPELDSVVVPMDPEGRPLGAFTGTMDEQLAATAAAQLADGSLMVIRRTTRENAFTGEITAETTRYTAPVPYRLSSLVIDEEAQHLYGATPRGEILWWELRGAELGRPQIVSAGPSAVTAMTLLIGNRSLVVGQEDGSISVWFAVREEEGGEMRLTRIRDFPAHEASVRVLSPSMRNRTFLAIDETGGAGFYFSTSRKVLWTGRASVAGVRDAFLAPRSDAAYLAGDRIEILAIDSPHPEIDLGSLFGTVWYEGYTEPDYVWQSTGGTDEFESKFSLTPLLVGTLKGTFYSLLLAIPLGVLGAMYTSQFLHPGYKRYVKPIVEIMAGLPTVVLGFLAGLWLAPRLELYFPALLLMVALIPMAVVATGLAWNQLPRAFQNRFPKGSETAIFLVVIGAVMWLSLEMSLTVETWLFDGSFQSWLRDATGMPYDQRNAVVVGLAMGFAVIPIIFSIAEDAFSNVPYNLVAGSLALGATRWQTVTRVVLPTASPGIFSGIMVGFGRAVGETMIVLMATGNTPLMDWSPFNGFRTLSANIAVEIPEAPQYGTLYRVLFLAALLLFVITFLVNTLAEVVRQTLRKRYAQL